MPNPWIEHVRRWSKANSVSYMCASSMPECREEYQAKKSAVERSVKGKSKIDTKKQSSELFRELNLERTKRAMKAVPAPQPPNIRIGNTVRIKKSEMKTAPQPPNIRIGNTVRIKKSEMKPAPSEIVV